MPHSMRPVLSACGAAFLIVLSAGCSGSHLEGPPFGRTSLAAPRLLRLGHAGAKTTSGAPEAIFVTWTRSGDPSAIGYYLYRDAAPIPDPGPDGNLDPALRVNSGNIIAEPPSGSEVTFVDDFGAAKPQVGLTYYYRVTVVDIDDEESYPSNQMSWQVHGHNVAGISPDAVYWGDTVSITGDTFGTYDPGTDFVKLQALGGSTIDAQIDNWADTQIDISVPAGAITGFVQVVIEAVMAQSDLPLTILNPYITSIDPEVGFVEQDLTIEGDNFGALQGSGTVAIGSTDVSTAVTAWSNGQIDLTVPDGVQQGDVVVTVSGVSGNGIQFTPRAEIIGISTSLAQAGEQITLGGRYFGSTQGSVHLISGQDQTITSWTDSAITFTLTGSPGDDGLFVTTADAIESNTLDITIEPPLSVEITGLDPGTFYTPLSAPSIGVNTAPNADSVDLFIDGVLHDTSITAPFSDLVLPVAALTNGDHIVTLTAHRRSMVANSIPAPVKVYSLVGDINGDGTVDGGDRDALGPLVGLDSGNASFLPWYDTDGDGLVTEADLSAVGYFFGNTTL